MLKVNIKDIKNDVSNVILVSLLLPLNIFHTFIFQVFRLTLNMEVFAVFNQFCTNCCTVLECTDIKINISTKWVKISMQNISIVHKNFQYQSKKLPSATLTLYASTPHNVQTH